MARQGLSPNYFITNEADIRLIQSVILHLFPVILNMRSVQLMETIIKLINQKIPLRERPKTKVQVNNLVHP